MSKRLLIVDGDLVAYRHAAAAESRTIIAKHLDSGREKEFKTRTATQIATNMSPLCLAVFETN